jgi:hypothetical protein
MVLDVAAKTSPVCSADELEISQSGLFRTGDDVSVRPSDLHWPGHFAQARSAGHPAIAGTDEEGGLHAIVGLVCAGALHQIADRVGCGGAPQPLEGTRKLRERRIRDLAVGEESDQIRVETYADQRRSGISARRETCRTDPVDAAVSLDEVESMPEVGRAFPDEDEPGRRIAVDPVIAVARAAPIGRHGLAEGRLFASRQIQTLPQSTTQSYMLGLPDKT